MARKSVSVASVLSKFGKSHLECAICHERYHDPKLLKCLHSFCEKCLLTYQESVENQSIIKCPVCRQNTELDSGLDSITCLRTNFHLMGMVEDFTLQEKLTQTKALKVICELCRDQQEATSRCMDCPFFLCANCQAIHQRISATASHDILTLDTLRSGVVSLRSKVQDEPPCEKHRGEKKRFYCLTCDKLICRDCTVVDHRESQHKFITLEEAACRFRQNTKDLILKFEENLSTYVETSTELTKMNTDLDKLMFLARQLVIEQATEEERKISERAEYISWDIARRQKLRTKTLYKNGIKIKKIQAASETTSTESSSMVNENKQKYSKTIDEKFSSLDGSLKVFDQTIATLLKTEQEMHALMDSLKSESNKDTSDDKSKVATSMDKLLGSVQDTFELKKSVIKEVGKITSAEIVQMRQTFQTASDVVKCASDVDFLNLYSVIDNYLNAHLVQSPPRLHPGYSKIEFKSCGDTGLGELVVGSTWKFTRDIRSNSGIISIGTFSNDEILLVSTQRDNYGRPYVNVYNAAGSYLRNISSSPGKVATFPNDSFAVISGTSGWLFAPNATSANRTLTLPSTINRENSSITLGNPVSVASYKDQQIIIGYSYWQGILVRDTSNVSPDRQIPVDIKPDFLASTSKGCILVGARNPGCVECLDGNETTSHIIHPTIGGSTDGKQVICLGICRDIRDAIYVAVSEEGATDVHIHQYSSYGSFIGCFSRGVIKAPVIGIGITGNDTLVIAGQDTLKLFKMSD